MYTHYYGFSAKPFQLSPDPRFFFGSSGHKRALAYLRYGLSQREGFIAVTGGVGTGKTILVRSLFKELDPNSVIAAQLVTTQLEADDLIRMVAAAFGLPHENLAKASLIKRLEDFLQHHARAGKRVLLVVDEAQNLPARSLEELRMLSNLQVSDTPLLQSFLLGQEEFRSTLQSPGLEQLRQRIIASCHLSPLSEQETRNYIEHRLRVADWQEDPPFTESAHTTIYRYTHGIPRRINVFCDRLLLYGFLEELKEFSDLDVEAVAKELGQEVSSLSVPQRSTASSQAAFAFDDESENRIAELERTVGSLVKRPNGNSEVVDLEKRISRLEPVVSMLRVGFTELTKRVNGGSQG